MQDNARRRLQTIVLAGLTAAAIMSLVLYVVLPAATQRLTAPQIAWLREVFNAHTSLLLLALLVAAALLGLPVFLVALWGARLRPWRSYFPGLRRDRQRVAIQPVTLRNE